jgi:hypothetical protein
VSFHIVNTLNTCLQCYNYNFSLVFKFPNDYNLQLERSTGTCFMLFRYFETLICYIDLFIRNLDCITQYRDLLNHYQEIE